VVRAGASTTLKKIFKRYNAAADLELSANNLLRDTAIPLEGTTMERTQGSINKLREQASTLKAKAKEIRSNIPDSLDVDQIRGALVKIISDEKANVQARVEAAQAAASIGLIKGEVAGAIVTGMQSPNRNVRQACARAAGAVDPTSSDDRQKITALLMAIVKYEPEKPHSEANVPPGAGADAPPAWGNDPLVRQAAAESLENIALVKSLPALIEALDDNSVSVRQAAHRALQVITRLDFGYEPDAQPLSRDQTLEAIVTQRREGQQKWQEWWDKTKGIAVLVERFWYFQSEWKEFDAVRLFEPEVFLGEVKSRQWASRDPKADLERAERVVKKFQGFKDIFAAEAIALGPEAIDLLLEFIGGETKKEPEGNAPTRWFVAEACARIINQHGVAEKVAAIRDKVNSGSDAKKIGASIALGFLDKDKTGASEREVLVRGLASQDNLLRTACANSLRKIGEAEANAPDLTRAATDANADDKVRLEALRAITQLKPKQKATIDAIGEMVYDEPTIDENRPSKMAKNAYVREMVVIALGAIADPAATKYLIRARRDTAKVVRLAATQAITSVYAAGKDTFKEEALKILKDERNKTLDRIGAAWTIGDTGDSSFARHLTFRLKDENPPLILKDRDSEVRKSVCEALARMGDKARDRTVVGTLIGVMGDEHEREGPRDAAYAALKSVTGQDVAKFNSTDIEQMRKEAVKKWQDWFKTADLPEEL
jgi:HEAT repeat protein